MTPAFFSRRLALLAALASSALLAACGGGGGGGGGNTNLRAINLTTDLPSIDLFTSDTRRFSGLATDAVATAISLEANTYTLNVKKANDGATLLTGSYTLAKDQNYTAVIWGRETALRVSTLPEDENVDNITDATNTKVRFFNATTDTGVVDVFITAANSELGEALPIQASLPSGSLSGFRDQSSGQYRLRVTSAGDPNDVRLDIPSITLPGKKYVTLVLTAGAGGVLVNGTLIEQRAGVTTLKNTKARVRMVASVAAAGNISACSRKIRWAVLRHASASMRSSLPSFAGESFFRSSSGLMRPRTPGSNASRSRSPSASPFRRRKSRPTDTSHRALRPTSDASIRRGVRGIQTSPSACR